MESFLYVCKQVGLTNEDMEDMTIGDCLDFVQEYVDQNKKQNKQSNVRKATQDDFDCF